MKQFVAFMLLAQSMLAGAAERPEDFAYGIAIHADAQDALYEITLPTAVYRGVARSDLGDIRVFNAHGEVVPHAFRPRAAGSTDTPAAVELPLFPLYAESGSSLEDLNVRIDKRADGTIVNILNRGKGVPGQRRLRGFVLDASGLKRPVQALQFDWKSSADGFAGKVRVEGGNDLARWHVLADNASLVSLDFGGRSLRQIRVELRVEQYKYLRVSWPESQPPLELLSVRAEPAAGHVEAERVWQALTALPASGKAGEYLYDLGGHFPFDRLRVELPQVNTLVQVQVLARANTSDDWRLRASAVTYRLHHQGKEVTSPEIAVAGSGERYWLLRVDQKGGGVGPEAPVINIGWPPQKLVFAARGAGPFQLTYGNSEAKAASYPIDSLIPGYKTESELKVKPAALGEQVTLSGAVRLRAPPDYKKWALWGTLILGVLVLGWMAYRLSRQISKPDANGAGESRTVDKLK